MISFCVSMNSSELNSLFLFMILKFYWLLFYFLYLVCFFFSFEVRVLSVRLLRRLRPEKKRKVMTDFPSEKMIRFWAISTWNQVKRSLYNLYMRRAEQNTLYFKDLSGISHVIITQHWHIFVSFRNQVELGRNWVVKREQFLCSLSYSILYI